MLERRVTQLAALGVLLASQTGGEERRTEASAVMGAEEADGEATAEEVEVVLVAAAQAVAAKTRIEVNFMVAGCAVVLVVINTIGRKISTALQPLYTLAPLQYVFGRGWR
jgi:hypothetical protein